MRLTVGQKVFWTIFLVMSLIVMIVIAATSLAIRRSMASYIAMAQLSFLDGFATQLEGIYRRDGNWSSLEGKPEAWQSLVEDAIRAIEEARQRPHLEEHIRNGTRPPPIDRYGQADRMALLDANGHEIAGWSGFLSDGAARRPLYSAGNLIGYLSAAVPSHPNEVDQRFMQESTRSMLYIGIAGALLSLLSAWFLSRNFVTPIRTLQGGTERLTSGDYAARIDLKRSDEFGDLVRDFNNLGATLAQQEKSRRQWVADTSHELRTPVAILRAQIEALKDDVYKPEPGVIRTLHSEVVALTKLVDDLHELARADAGGLALRREKLDPIELADEVFAGFAPRFHAQRLQVDVQNSVRTGAQVFADPDRMRQVFANILENTLRYTDAGGRFRISYSIQGNWIKICFDDTAPGVADDLLPHIFDRFFRVEGSRNRATAGSGLGLAICKSLIEAHEGRISARPSPLGGLTLEIMLPSQGRQA